MKNARSHQRSYYKNILKKNMPGNISVYLGNWDELLVRTPPFIFSTCQLPSCDAAKMLQVFPYDPRSWIQVKKHITNPNTCMPLHRGKHFYTGIQELIWHLAFQFHVKLAEIGNLLRGLELKPWLRVYPSLQKILRMQQRSECAISVKRKSEMNDAHLGDSCFEELPCQPFWMLIFLMATLVPRFAMAEWRRPYQTGCHHQTAYSGVTPLTRIESATNVN